jgi:hypothetical protein
MSDNPDGTSTVAPKEGPVLKDPRETSIWDRITSPLRFRSATKHGGPWSVPCDFYPDDSALVLAVVLFDTECQGNLISKSFAERIGMSVGQMSPEPYAYTVTGHRVCSMGSIRARFTVENRENRRSWFRRFKGSPVLLTPCYASFVIIDSDQFEVIIGKRTINEYRLFDGMHELNSPAIGALAPPKHDVALTKDARRRRQQVLEARNRLDSHEKETQEMLPLAQKSKQQDPHNTEIRMIPNLGFSTNMWQRNASTMNEIKDTSGSRPVMTENSLIDERMILDTPRVEHGSVSAERTSIDRTVTTSRSVGWDENSESSSRPASVFSELSATSTAASNNNRQEFLTITQQFVELLVRDKGLQLQNLYTLAMRDSRIGSERFTNNLRRLLKTLGADLARESSARLESLTSKFVSSRSRPVASLIRHQFDPMYEGMPFSRFDNTVSNSDREGITEALLQRHTLLDPADTEGESDVEDENLDGSSVTFLEEQHLKNLDTVQAFVLNSKAYKNFCHKLHALVRPVGNGKTIESATNRLSQEKESNSPDRINGDWVSALVTRLADDVWTNALSIPSQQACMNLESRLAAFSMIIKQKIQITEEERRVSGFVLDYRRYISLRVAQTFTDRPPVLLRRCLRRNVTEDAAMTKIRVFLQIYCKRSQIGAAWALPTWTIAASLAVNTQNIFKAMEHPYTAFHCMLRSPTNGWSAEYDYKVSVQSTNRRLCCRSQRQYSTPLKVRIKRSLRNQTPSQFI